MATTTATVPTMATMMVAVVMAPSMHEHRKIVRNPGL
jgi:hypothetical protein